MQIVYAHERPPEAYAKSIFLAGPTPRPHTPPGKGWRERALRVLSDLGYDGIVFVPEPRDGNWTPDYTAQVTWEQEMRQRSDAIAFWVPRDADMPAYTTNVEFGEDYGSGRAHYGRPDEAVKCRYLDAIWRTATGEEPFGSLDQLMAAIVDELGSGALRHGGQTCVPLHVWRHPTFARWMASQTKAGNRLDDARVVATFPHAGRRPFLFIVHVSVWVDAEQRHKSNEFILGRSDVSTVVPVHGDLTGPAEDLMIGMAEEFRSPATNARCKVLECPGGSGGGNALAVALAEIEEEMGLEISAKRLVSVATSQLAATLSTHQASVYAVQLTDDEAAYIEKMHAEERVFGVDDDERVLPRLVRVGDLLDQGVDLSTYGAVMAAIDVLRKQRPA